MSHHTDERNTPELNSLLEAHHLATDKPSQLSDAFRLGYWASQAEIARLQGEVDRLTAGAFESSYESAKLITFAENDRDTAWNDAIEAAAEYVDHLSSGHADEIRALKRPTQDPTT